MKTMMKMLVLPAMLLQMSFAPQAKAEMNGWKALGIFGLGALTGYVVAQLPDNDQQAMQQGYNNSFSAELRLGDRQPWQGGQHNGYFQYESSGRSSDGRYSNCRLMRPYVYNQNGQQAQNYSQPRCSCQDSNGGWVEIPYSSYQASNTQQGPYYNPSNPTYQGPVYQAPPYQASQQYANNGHQPTPGTNVYFSGRPLRSQEQPHYRPQQPYYPPQQQTYYQPQYPSNDCNEGNLLNICFAATVGI